MKEQSFKKKLDRLVYISAKYGLYSSLFLECDGSNDILLNELDLKRLKVKERMLLIKNQLEHNYIDLLYKNLELKGQLLIS